MRISDWSSDVCSSDLLLAAGKDVLFDIDWQGGQQLYQEAGPDVVRVFILPPTMDELERRLRARDTDSDEVIAARMARAANEISHWDGYDYVLIDRKSTRLTPVTNAHLVCRLLLEKKKKKKIKA